MYKVFFWVIWVICLPLVILSIGFGGWEIFDFTRYLYSFDLIEFVISIGITLFFIIPAIVLLTFVLNSVKSQEDDSIN